MAQLFPGGQLRGMIVCGPLAPQIIPDWLGSNLKSFKNRGLKIDGYVTEPEAGSLWLSADDSEPISEGAMIYGQKRLAEIPSYLDTMPQISILAQERGQRKWFPLLKADEVEGGKEHKDTIRERFQLDAGKRNLGVYLYKGPVDEAMKQMEDSSDPQAIPAEGIDPCQARLLREFVRAIGSLENVNKGDFFRDEPKKARYMIEFAKALFSTKAGEETKTVALPLSETTRTPLRSAIFDFPSAPEQNTVLDIQVRIRPVSGLAKIEILPKDDAFLQGDRVLLNYSTMRVAPNIPSGKRGWPGIEEIVVDPEDLAFHSIKILNEFMSTSPASPRYIGILDVLRDKVLKGPRGIPIPGRNSYVSVRAIDQNGQACTEYGNIRISQIAAKLKDDFRLLQEKPETKDVRDIMGKVFSRAGWLYSKTPSNIVEYIREEVNEGSSQWRTAVESASRAFITVEDFRLLFRSIDRRAGGGIFDATTFPINAARSICNVLMWRRNGEQGLDSAFMARRFASGAIVRLKKEEKKDGKFKTTYFQMIRLLFYLLRYRKTDPSCFDPDSPTSISVFEEAKKSLEVAKRSFPVNSKKITQIKQLIEGFDKYLHYEATEDVISVLRALADSDDKEGSDDEE
ncbi:MAG: hypothetical protein HQK57_07800 [Deltaproteobacteria bacterium]|nr:hypothetical protein [Deltaproteobacteria bacterium]